MSEEPSRRPPLDSFRQRCAALAHSLTAVEPRLELAGGRFDRARKLAVGQSVTSFAAVRMTSDQRVACVVADFDSRTAAVRFADTQGWGYFTVAPYLRPRE